MAKMPAVRLRAFFLFFVIMPAMSVVVPAPWRACGQSLPPLDSLMKASDASGSVPDYDVFSVKENKSGDHMMRMAMRPDGFSYTNITLKNLIASAYGVREDLIGGEPGWVSSRHFDFEAKVAGADVAQYRKLGAAQRRTMLRTLLVECFHLKVHTETRQLPIYELQIAKGGVKMTEAPPPPPLPDGAKVPDGVMSGKIMMQPGHIQADGLTMTGLATQVGSMLRQTVVDKTGLTARYGVDLRWTPEDAPVGGDAGADAPPSIFTAVQEQLGLRLQATKGPVETIVVDAVELPAEN